MAKQIDIPDLGGADNVEVIEVCVKVGDTVDLDTPLVVLESDKASMEVPAPFAGTVVSLAVSVGDTVAEGNKLAEIEEGDGTEPAEQDQENSTLSSPPVSDAAAEEQQPVKKTVESEIKDICAPDLGGADDVEVIEICVAVGDRLELEDSIVVLESDKASMEVPADVAGELLELAIKVGDKVKEGDLLAKVKTQVVGETEQSQPGSSEKPARSAPKPLPASNDLGSSEGAQSTSPRTTANSASQFAYAGPAVRKQARELGVDLSKIKGSGKRGRILKEDLARFIRDALSGRGGTGGIPEVPAVDFVKFGGIQLAEMSRLHRATALNMLRSWLNVPHVTHFDEADFTELVAFRQSLKEEMSKRNIKLTPLAFLVKACAFALKEHSQFNASLHVDGKRLFLKQYVHIGVAVDTPAGLMVPVVRDADKKDVWAIASNIFDLAKNARNKKLKPQDMQGGCFTISSLGNIGGTAFTPIVNTPEVAILGVSRLTAKPVYVAEELQRRQMLPLSLSYDHRAVNGADAGRYMTTLIELLATPERLID